MAPPKGFPKPAGSGRQPGALNKATSEIKEAARVLGPKAIERLAELAGLVDGMSPAQNEQARIVALRELLDRGYGRPVQPIGGDPDEPITVVIQKYTPGFDEPAEVDDSQIELALVPLPKAAGS